jgi:isoleucyl-tRNA synthetase
VTVFENTVHDVPVLADADALLTKWDMLRAWKVGVTKAIEDVRAQGKVGSSLQAELDVYAQGDLLAALQSLGDDLRFLTITSRATVHEGEERVVVHASTHTKCERCWHYRDDVGHDAEHPGICGRCTSNLYGEGEARSFA